MSKSDTISKTKRRPRPNAIKQSPRSPVPDHALNHDRGGTIGRSLAQVRHPVKAAPPVPRELIDKAIQLNDTQGSFSILLQACPMFCRELITPDEADRFLAAVTVLRHCAAAQRAGLPRTIQRYLNARDATPSPKDGLFTVETERLREIILGRAPSERTREEWIQLILGAMAVQRAELDQLLGVLRAACLSSTGPGTESSAGISP